MGRYAYMSALVVVGCTLPGTLAIDRVEPSSGTSIADVPVRIEGTDFHLPITSNIDDGNTTVGDMTVTIGNVPLLGATWRDTQLIEGSVPAGLATGSYLVTVRLGDHTDVLVDGYTVTDSRVVPPPGPCGKPGAIADDFQDGVTASRWRVTDAASIVEQAGTLAITPAGVPQAGYRSDPHVDLIGAAAEVEVRTVPTAGTGAIASFRFSHRADSFGIDAVDGQLELGVATASSVTIPYDPIAHRHWRVDEAAGTLRFATSPDGVTWTEQHAAPTPAWASYVSIGLLALNPAGAGAPGTATFAEFSTYVAPAAWCASSSLSDGFNDGTIGREWVYHGRSSSGCTESESGTAAHVDQAGTAACDAYYGTSALYTLESSQILARITAITTFTAGWITYLGLWDLTGQFVRLYFEQNMMCVDGTGITKTCASYTTTEDLWRIREAAGTVFFETASTAGMTWRAVYSGPAPFPITAVRPRFGTLTDRTIGQSIGLGVDRFN